MNKTAIICIQGGFGKILSRLLTKYGFEGRNDIQLDSVVNDAPSLQPISDRGIFCVWADDLYHMGMDGAASWLTRLRIAKSDCHSWPVIVFGYDTHLSFLRSLKAPRILASPGIEYIQLPCDLDVIKQNVHRSLPVPESVIREYIKDHDHAKRLSDQLAHDIGNFYAMFRLLHGAYLNGTVSEDDYVDVFIAVEGIQETNPKLTDHLAYKEFMFLRRDEIYTETSGKPSCSQPLAKGKKILLIDDAASLGWAEVLACLFAGSAESPTKKEQQGIKILRQSDFLALGRTNPLNQTGGDTFFTALSNFIDNSEKHFISGKDLILLDLRLRHNEDEKVQTEQCSGVEILKKIRRVSAGVPVIIFTASRKASSVEVVKQWGADDYFIKDPGSIGEHPDDIKAYYQDFRDKVNNAITKAYHRDLWKGIEDAICDDEVRCFLKQAFVLIRHQPSKFEQGLSYTPYVAAVVALGNAIEKYVGCGPTGGYEAAVKRFYDKTKERDLEGFARHLGFLRNKAAHPQSAMVISESDARIACLLALWSIRGGFKSKPQAQFILDVTTIESGEIIARKVFSCLRKKINSKTSIPNFNKHSYTYDICKSICSSELSVSYLTFLMKRLFDHTGDKGYENILLFKMLQRFSEIESINENLFQPQYEESEEGFPFVCEAFRSDQQEKWYVSGSNGIEIAMEDCAWESTFKKKDSGHTQPFLFLSSDRYGPWGPEIPYGYEEDKLKESLSLRDSLVTLLERR